MPGGRVVEAPEAPAMQPPTALNRAKSRPRGQRPPEVAQEVTVPTSASEGMPMQEEDVGDVK